MLAVRTLSAAALAALLWAPALLAQHAATAARVEVSQSSLALEVGDSTRLSAKVFNAAGNEIDAPVVFFSSSRRRLAVSRDGKVEALRGGEYQVIAVVRSAFDVRERIPVTVAYPPVTRVDVHGGAERLFEGAAVKHTARVFDAVGDRRREVPVVWSTDNTSVATVDRYGVLLAHKGGNVTLIARAGGITSSHRYRVERNPISSVRLTASADSARTGDVIHFSVEALDGSGRAVTGAPVTYTLVPSPDDSIVAASPAGEVDDTGRFVAELPGDYTVLADVAGNLARRTVRITPRQASQQVKLVGRAPVRDVRTSDLWIWEGVDGRDYAVTGTHSAKGAAYFWDVTDAAAPELVDSVVVDARTVNDVKISEDGRIAVISREGASNRRNGFVILDVTNPRDVETISAFDDGLTGGVHNVFIYRGHVYAVNNGRRFDVINIEDPKTPYRVGQFELDTPGHAIHDIWVVDGIAYTSNWGDGVVLIDVGNGVAGGSPSNPVEIARYADFGGATHAAFPYRSPTGKFYVFMGDERGRPGFDGLGQDTPSRMAGYIHVVDFTDHKSPEEVARYEIPEAGSHNLWIEDDRLYAAFYNGGLRVVDVSGELKGNLGAQGREIGHYMSYDPEGNVANAPLVWGPQPYKGNVYFSDMNSGLWTVKVEPRQQPTP